MCIRDRYRPWQRQQPIFFEHEGNAAVRAGPFKLVRLHGCDWELYDMDSDRTELNNIKEGNRSIVVDLEYQYENWARHQGVIDWEVALPKLLSAWNLTSTDG